MTVAGGFGLLGAESPLGWLADRLGAREVYAALLAFQGAASLAYLAVGGTPAFVLVACVAETTGARRRRRNALVLGLAEDRLVALGSLRSISHVGWAIGAVAGAVIIGVDSRPAYVALLLLDAGSYVVYALLVLSVPRVPPAPQRRGLRAVRDRPYVTLAALMGVLALCWAMMSSGLPLWVALHTDAPISAVIVVLNSLAIALLQVRVSRSMVAPAVAAARRAARRHPPRRVMRAVRADGGRRRAGRDRRRSCSPARCTRRRAVFVAASWGLSVPLMPDGAHGEYQGVFATGEATALMLAPALMTTLVAGWGRPGWLVLAAMFVLPAAMVSRRPAGP